MFGKIRALKRTGKKIVLVGGVFNILHPGHLFFLERSREFGDILVVIVARDRNVKKRFVIPEKQRLEMVRSLRMVDFAILGNRGNFLGIARKIEPDVVVLGPDQRHNEDDIKKALKTKVIRIKRLKKCGFCKSSGIIDRMVI